jgi:hypothetical protein
MPKTGGKYPWAKFYPSDWMNDTQLSICSPQTRGIWIDIICAMHESDRCGELGCTYKQLSRLCRCSIEEIKSAISELSESKTADVTIDNGYVTLINRRMKREYTGRVSSRHRQRNHRSKKKSNADVTVQKSYIREQRSEDCPTDIATQSPKVSVNKETLLQVFSKEFEILYEVEYHASFGKDGKLLKDLASQSGRQKVVEGIRYFFKEFVNNNKFAGKKPDVGMLSLMWNGMIAVSRKANTNLSITKEWVNE